MSRLIVVAHWLAVVAWAVVIFVLSAQPRLPQPLGFSARIFAIGGHLIAYFILSTLTAIALYRSGLSPGRAASLAVVVSVLYGVSDEWHQSFVPGRDPSPFDVALDLTGASAAALVAHHWMFPRFERASRR